MAENEAQKNGTTKLIKVNMPQTRSWKLTPEDLTLIKQGLEGLEASPMMKAKSLDKRRRSLLKRMKGDFFMKLYATGRWSSEDVSDSDAQNGAA